MDQVECTELSNEVISESENLEVALVQDCNAQLVYPESMDGDTNKFCCSCESFGGDIDELSVNFSRFLESESLEGAPVQDYNAQLVYPESMDGDTNKFCCSCESFGGDIDELSLNLGKSFNENLEGSLVKDCNAQLVYPVATDGDRDTNKFCCSCESFGGDIDELSVNFSRSFESESLEGAPVQDYNTKLVYPEATDGDINKFYCICESFGGDIDEFSVNFSRSLESVNSKSIKEVLDFICMKIKNNEQQSTAETITKLKMIVGETFTVLLIYLSVILNDTRENLVRNCEIHQQYAAIISELEGSLKILNSIEKEFANEKHKGDFLQYVLLPILFDRANETAHTIQNVWHLFQESLPSYKIDALLSIYNGIARVVEGMKGIDYGRSFNELINDIQQLKACLDHVEKITGEFTWRQISVQIDLSIWIHLSVFLTMDLFICQH